ncbi:hypothetical protein KAW55_03230 [bacterium]|nr:hypothetical protein [bacterium]
MKFRYYTIPVEQNEAFPARRSVKKPLIPICLMHNGNMIKLLALIDSGADNCIFRAEFGEQVGIDIMSGKRADHRGITGRTTPVYFHDVTIKVGGWEHNVYAGFSYQIPVSALGQNGFFDLYRIEFNLPKEQMELKEITPRGRR